MDAIRPEVQEQIVRILTELEAYLTKANQLDWMALSSIIASFLISVVAICISLKTAKDQKKLLQKQNDIALFDKKIECISKFKDFSYALYFCLMHSESEEAFIDRFYYKLGITEKNEKEKAELFIYDIRTVNSLKYLFSNKVSDIIEEWFALSRTIFFNIALYSFNAKLIDEDIKAFYKKKQEYISFYDEKIASELFGAFKIEIKL
ncbi:MAG: hypothetical protein JXN65_07195 [Clostridia bacterium]|nr:hypothetical protein [Clostridia bacterium]